MKGTFRGVNIGGVKIMGESAFELKAPPSKPIHIKGVPCDVMRDFKAACATEGKSMHDVFINLMQIYASHIQKVVKR